MAAMQMEALLQIKACMAAPSEPVACVMLRADGSSEEIVTDHRKIRELLKGTPTVVGAIASLGVQAVMTEGAKKKTKHVFPETFDPNIKGDVLLFRINEEAAPMPFTPKEYKDWVDAGCPDEVEDGEEDAGEEEYDKEEEGDEDESEEDEGEEEEGEEEEGEEEDFETFAEKLKALPKSALMEVCQQMNVSASGTKDQLIARLHEAAQAAAEEDDDDDDEEEEEEEEAEEEEAPTPAPPQGKVKASTGPVKTISKKSKAKRA